jgi:hypothetical protein
MDRLELAAGTLSLPKPSFADKPREPRSATDSANPPSTTMPETAVHPR